ncbi:MAG TPA: thioredoxin domain-containing protein, partial [Steroidobacteraceae bacterium]
MQRNRLAAETSPYLQQHADNPVDWYPWGEQALLAAKQQNKPILLSIGYSACHWCHVMAHESFEDPATAALMNQLFVNIKVDREERPDLDKIYQVAQQLITHGSGGWPLTMFLTPDEQAPFFGGTYFPKEPRHGMPAFSDLLRRVAQYFHGHGAEIAEQNRQLKLAFSGLEPEPQAAVTLDAAPLAEARSSLERSFDAQFGGFSQAPKFPHPGSIERCLRQWHATSTGTTPDLKALYMASLTLTRMAEGGIYDQLGGGFSRYSVDGQWMIPHFEKMLYDNGQLLCEFARAFLATGEPLFAHIAADTADWVLRDMRSPQGGFYSSLDADSEGHEGKFYVWSRTEAQALLTPQEYAAFSRRFGLDRDANFEGEWHLHTGESIDAIAAALGESAPTVAALIESARAKLLKVRE